MQKHIAENKGGCTVGRYSPFSNEPLVISSVRPAHQRKVGASSSNSISPQSVVLLEFALINPGSSLGSTVWSVLTSTR